MAAVAGPLGLGRLGLVVLEHEVLGREVGRGVGLVLALGRRGRRRVDVQVAHEVLELLLRDAALRVVGLGGMARMVAAEAVTRG